MKLSHIHKKFDWLIAFSTIAIGFEYVPSLVGVDLKGLSLAWLVLPLVLFISLIKHMKRYLKGKIIGLFFLFSIVLLSYVAAVDWNENVPFFTVPEVVKSFILSFIVMTFYMVHGKEHRGIITYFNVLIVVGFVAVVLNTLALFGIIERGIEITHLGGKEYITRISPIGDPNISIIYILGLAVSYPFWKEYLKPTQGYVMGVGSLVLVILGVLGGASRGGFLALTMTILVVLVGSWLSDKNKRIIVLILIIILLPFALFAIMHIPLPEIFKTIVFRFSYLTNADVDYAVEGRIGAIKWFFYDIFSGPNLVGIGFGRYSSESASFAAEWLPHNSFIDMYIIGGVAGFILYVTLWYQSAIGFIRLSRSNNPDEKLYGLCGIAYGFGLAVLIMSVSIPFIKLIWAYLGIGIAQYQKRIEKYNYHFG